MTNISDAEAVGHLGAYPKELEGRTTVDLWPTTGRLLGLSKNATYQAAERGQIVTLRLGRKWVVPTQPLLRQLGYLN